MRVGVHVGRTAVVGVEVGVAEALRQPIRHNHVLGLRWSDGRYVVDRYPRDGQGVSIYDRMNTFGVHEIVIETPGGGGYG